MSVLFAWVPTDPDRPTETTIATMGAALRSRADECAASWTEPGFGIARLARPGSVDDGSFAPLQLGGLELWMIGEVFRDTRSHELTPADPRAFRRRILTEIAERGIGVVRHFDGEFWVAVWNARERTLQLACDRFAGLPLYHGASPDGVAIAGGVRGVLMAPGLHPEPDRDAIREAVTFGGFRLGSRTNVSGVAMLPGGSTFTLREGRVETERYWSYRDIPELAERPLPELYERADALWADAVAARLSGPGRFGQTLSGGLDSRAILGEASPQKESWQTITYGVPNCDDVRYARRAATAAGVGWHYYDLYRAPEPDWLTSRSEHIQSTDGLADLFDLMHVESVAIQAEHLDVHLSGYIGDAVSGPTFASVASTQDVMFNLPYYGEMAMPFAEALDRVQALVDALGEAPPRYALFENKLPQATNRWPTAWRPWLVVRKPFVDYAWFDFWQGLPLSVRVDTNLYERWLAARYPELFAKIPNQKTGVPVMTPRWRHQLTRAARFGWRRFAPVLGVTPPSRLYHDVRTEWTTREMRSRIEEVILRPDSLSAELIGRDELATFLSGWFETGAGPTQVVASLYVFEHYHRDLASHLHAARTRAVSAPREQLGTDRESAPP